MDLTSLNFLIFDSFSYFCNFKFYHYSHELVYNFVMMSFIFVIYQSHCFYFHRSLALFYFINIWLCHKIKCFYRTFQNFVRKCDFPLAGKSNSAIISQQLKKVKFSKSFTKIFKSVAFHS